MMLSTALNKMINNSECIIFLNTSNSISSTNVGNVINSKTNSPWIYSELLTTRLITKKPLADGRMNKDLFLEHSVNCSQLTIEYDAELNHLIKLSDSNLDSLCFYWKDSSPEDALDELYRLKGLTKEYYKNVFK